MTDLSNAPGQPARGEQSPLSHLRSPQRGFIFRTDPRETDWVVAIYRIARNGNEHPWEAAHLVQQKDRSWQVMVELPADRHIEVVYVDAGGTIIPDKRGHTERTSVKFEMGGEQVLHIDAVNLVRNDLELSRRV